MTTNTTNSQAASIDTPEFRELFHVCESYLILHDDDDQYRADVTALVAYIDTKLAQARHEAWCEGVNIDALREHNAELESRLAEIQRGVEGLSIPYEVSAFRVAPRKAVWLDEVLALLQPQGQADTSGLPG